MFVFLDESGDLGFDWSKRGTSRYFTVTILICYSKETTNRIRIAVNRTLKNKVNHRKVLKKNKELKGATTTIEIKKYFYNQMPEDGWDIYSVTLNKERVKNYLKTKIAKKRLYNFLARFIVEKTPLREVQGKSINFIVDKCKNTVEIQDFNEYIEAQLSAILPMDTVLNIYHESSTKNLCIQAVDLFCWGIARKHKNNDTAWYNYFKSRIKYEEIYLPSKKR
jgi:hypothetical protein